MSATRKRDYEAIWWRDLPTWSRWCIGALLLSFTSLASLDLKGDILAIAACVAALSMAASLVTIFGIRIGLIKRRGANG